MSAMIMETQGKTDLATKRYQEVLALDPAAVIASNNLAWIYADAGTNLDAALALSQAAVAKAPDTPELMDTLGWVYYKKNLPELAIPLFARSVEKAPRDASYHYHLGLAYLQSGDQTRGRAALQQALSAKPDARTAEEIQGALGKIPPAAPK
jgi:tetratricopeptide (TPR) repeat protein